MKTGNNPVHSSKITTEITSNNLPIDTMGTKRTHMDLREMERRASDTSIPQATHTLQYLNSVHPHFALIYLDHDGKPRIESSSSYAESLASSDYPNNNIFIRPDVTEQFMRMAPPNLQSMTYTPNQPQGQLSSWDIQSGSGWMNPGHAQNMRPAEMIPCEWQSTHNRRKRQRPAARDRPKSSTPPAAAPGRTVLRVGDRNLLRRYYYKAFETFQQINCRVIGKSYVKLVEPRKQVHFPYNGRRVISGVPQTVDPELTKPGWWPKEVEHKEPDHLKTHGRVKLLVHILCELKDSHGITAEKLREAGQDVRRQINPPIKAEVLDEIYFVRQMEEQYIDGKIDENTLIQISHTSLPVDDCEKPGDKPSPSQMTPVSTQDLNLENHQPTNSQNLFVDGTNQTYPPQQQGAPLSPATSDSSGPHSPTNTNSNVYPISMSRPGMPKETQTGYKPVVEAPNYMSGFFPAHFQVPASKPSNEYWSNVPPMPDVSPYGY